MTLVHIGKLADAVLQAVISKREEFRAEEVIAVAGVTATTAITVDKRSEANLRELRANLHGIVEVEAGFPAVQNGDDPLLQRRIVP